MRRTRNTGGVLTLSGEAGFVAVESIVFHGLFFESIDPLRLFFA